MLDFGSLRVLVVHEWLYTWAGAERTLEQMMHVLPQADLVVGVVSPAMRQSHPIARRARETWVGRLPGARRHHRWFLPMHALAWRNLDTSGYDLVISNSHAFEKCVRVRDGTAHICYCYSPPRYIWDMQSVYEQRGTLAERAALAIVAPALRTLDRRGAAGVDHFMSISRTVAARVARHYGRESDVVCPPVEAKRAERLDAGVEGRFLLYLGRLVGYKRVDLIIEAAQRLGRRLVVAGEGPDRQRLQRLASSQTLFLGEVSEARAAALLTGCDAFVFAGEEDFGIAPVEANAHARPVVYYDRGGLSETMIPGRTGIACASQTIDAFAEAIERCLGSRWDPETLRANATRFAPDRFRDAFGQALVRGLESARTSPRSNAEPAIPVA